MVTQGYIECIAMKTPRELSAMFEQISGSYVYKTNYKRYIFLLLNSISFINFNCLVQINQLCYDRLKMKLAQVEDEIQFTQNIKKQLLMNKKYTIIEKEKAEKYLQLQEQYVCQAITIFNLYNIVSNIICTFLKIIRYIFQ